MVESFLLWLALALFLWGVHRIADALHQIAALLRNPRVDMNVGTVNLVVKDSEESK